MGPALPAELRPSVQALGSPPPRRCEHLQQTRAEVPRRPLPRAPPRWERQRSREETRRLRDDGHGHTRESHGQERYTESKFRFLRVSSTLALPHYLGVRIGD